MLEPLAAMHLPRGVRARFIPHVNGLRVHMLEAGDEGQPLLLLLHGFPELAYSWRRIMQPLAQAGFHVVAPDQRGYGRTTGATPTYHEDLTPYRPMGYVRDALALVAALGLQQVACVIGHDFGAPVAGNCALARPDVFGSVVMMSAPYGGPRAWPLGPQAMPEAASGLASPVLHAALAALDPPREHYQWFYSMPGADADMRHAPQGLHAFLRAYYHHKSADWPGNRPHPLTAFTAASLAVMPTYYIMPAGVGMAATVRAEMPTPAEIAANAWLPDAALAVYAAEYGRTGFQGGLQSYRCTTSGQAATEMRAFAGQGITVPSCFIAGASDWGVHQKPGEFELMQGGGCRDSRGCHLIPGAGHWVQQEQPAEVVRHILDFLGAMHG